MPAHNDRATCDVSSQLLRGYTLIAPNKAPATLCLSLWIPPQPAIWQQTQAIFSTGNEPRAALYLGIDRSALPPRNQLWPCYKYCISARSYRSLRHWSRGMMEASHLCTCKRSMLSTRVRVPDGAENRWEVTYLFAKQKRISRNLYS